MSSYGLIALSILKECRNSNTIKESVFMYKGRGRDNFLIFLGSKNPGWQVLHMIFTVMSKIELK